MPEEKNEVDKLLDEHRGCLELLDKVESALDGFPMVVQKDELLNNLRRLDETLREHFEGEEAGFLAELPVEQPQLASSFQELEDEHGVIIDYIQTLIRKVREPENYDEPGRLKTLKAQGRRLFLTIRRHEAEENELVMDTYWLTLGNVD